MSTLTTTPSRQAAARRLPVNNARALAAALREQDLPGQRSMTAIERLRRTRREARPARRTLDLTGRLHARILSAARAEIVRRGGETEIHGRHSVAVLAVVDRDPGARMALVAARGWRDYGRRSPARRAELAYLYGVDDNGRWAVRVPGTVTTVAQALAWLTPVEVLRAQDAGRRVWRQGDVYVIATTARRDGRGADQLDTAHQWRPQTRTLVHRAADGRNHRPVRVPATPVEFVQQRTLAMGRGNGWANGD